MGFLNPKGILELFLITWNPLESGGFKPGSNHRMNDQLPGEVSILHTDPVRVQSGPGWCCFRYTWHWGHNDKHHHDHSRHHYYQDRFFFIILILILILILIIIIIIIIIVVVIMIMIIVIMIITICNCEMLCVVLAILSLDYKFPPACREP